MILSLITKRNSSRNYSHLCTEHSTVMTLYNLLKAFNTSMLTIKDWSISLVNISPKNLLNRLSLDLKKHSLKTSIYHELKNIFLIRRKAPPPKELTCISGG